MISPERIHTIAMDALWRDEEMEGKTREEMIAASRIGEGALQVCAFHPERLESHRNEVAAMLLELPPVFLQSDGGGASFLEACMDRDGHQWGEHRDMDSLFILGNALGLSTFLLPRAMWEVLPGGMPYVVVLDVPPTTPQP